MVAVTRKFRQDGLAPLEERVVPVALRLALLFDLPQRVADVADDLGVREVDRVDLGRNERDVQDDGLRSGEDAGSEVLVVVVVAAVVVVVVCLLGGGARAEARDCSASAALVTVTDPER